MTCASTARLGSVAGLVVLLAGLASCTTEAPVADPSPTSIPEASRVLRVGVEDWPACIHPLTCDSVAARDLVFQHVLPRAFEIGVDGAPVPSPLLSEEPTTEVDPATGKQTITYRVDPAARWNDGQPITSSDFVATWHARMDTPAADRTGYDRITGVDDRDPLVAVVSLDRPMADWRELFGGHLGWLLQADALGADTDLTGEFTSSLPFGAGPFELLAFDPDTIVLEARDEYWSEDRIPAVDQVRIERMPAGASPEAVDVFVPASEQGAVPGFVQRTVATTSVLGLWFDQRSAPLADPAVRAAIDAAIDRTQLARLAVAPDDQLPEVVTCLGWLPTDPVCDAVLPEVDNDPAVADYLLVAAGWTLDGEGRRFRDRTPLVLPITYDGDAARRRAVADAVRLSLGSLGVAVEETEVDRETWASTTRTETTGIGVFSVELGTADRAARLYGCAGEGTNPLGWCDPAIGALAEEVSAEVRPDALAEAAARLGVAVAQQVPWLPLHQLTRSFYVLEGAVTGIGRQAPGGGPLWGLYEFDLADR